MVLAGLGRGPAVGRAAPDLPLRGPVVLVDLVRDRDLDPAVLVGRAHRGKDLPARVGRAAPDLPLRHLAGLVGRADLPTVDLGDRRLLDRDLVDLVDLVDRVDRAMVGLGDQDLAGLPDPHRRRTRPGALSIEAAHKWADLRTRRTGSAHPTTVRRLRRRNTDSGGTAGLLPERRRQTGTVRRLPVVGTVRRLRVVGTVDGTGRRAT